MFSKFLLFMLCGGIICATAAIYFLVPIVDQMILSADPPVKILIGGAIGGTSACVGLIIGACVGNWFLK